MQWTRAGDTEWRLAASGFDGRAGIQATNQGFIASITVRETEFDMELMDEREFFEAKEDAVAFLQERMDRDSY